MKELIQEIERKQKQVIALVKEYHLSKEFDRMKQEFGTFYQVKDGFLMDQDGKILADRPERIKSYLRLRNVPPERILDFEQWTNS